MQEKQQNFLFEIECIILDLVLPAFPLFNKHSNLVTSFPKKKLISATIRISDFLLV